MSWKCFFTGHRMEMTAKVKQQMVDESGTVVGYDVYMIQECEVCKFEKGTHIDYFWKTPKSIDPDYIRIVYSKSKD